MADIVEQRLYKEVDLRRLFKSYMLHAPLLDREVCQHVIDDLKAELEVR